MGANSCCAEEEAGDTPSHLAGVCLDISRDIGGILYHVQLSSSGKGSGRSELVTGQRQHPARLHTSGGDIDSCFCGAFPSAWLRAFHRYFSYSIASCRHCTGSSLVVELHAI